MQKELKEIDRDKASGVTIQINDGNLQKLTGFVEGPRDTAYDGGYFVVDIALGKCFEETAQALFSLICASHAMLHADNQYPFVPPKMRFITKVWHPNVSSANGAICLDILKDQWSPALTLKTALLSLQALLSSPEPNDPQVRQHAQASQPAEQTLMTFVVSAGRSCCKAVHATKQGVPATSKRMDSDICSQAKRK